MIIKSKALQINKCNFKKEYIKKYMQKQFIYNVLIFWRENLRKDRENSPQLIDDSQ
jgi:hypothetical protein